MNKLQLYFFLLFVVVLAASCDSVAPGGEKTRSETITAQVFVDENVNGRFDPNEPAIPDTLVVAQSNVHGSFTQTAALTDADGTVDLSAKYTHIFDVAVVPPCGFEATTAVILSARNADNGVLAFGFRPEYVDLGMADIQVQLWQDDYEDGVMEAGERPLTDTIILFAPDIAWTGQADYYTGLLSVQTDENGIASTSFGNGCSIVWIAPQGKGHFTKIRPAAIYEEDRIGFAYGGGLLDVRMGVTDKEIQAEPASVPPHQFRFANGSPHHPEGFGEWQLLLDRGGYFTLKHIVQDEEKDYGVITLLPAQTEQLWQLIEAADLASVPSSTGEAVPDTPVYTFTLVTDEGDHVTTMWSTEAQDNQAIQDLLDGLTEVIKSHTGAEIVLR